MPIDREAFEAGERRYSIEDRIVTLLRENHDRAYNVREITIEVMDLGLSERDVERPSDVRQFVAAFVDVATVSAILDRLVDNGMLERRIGDAGEGERCYYRIRRG